MSVPYSSEQPAAVDTPHGTAPPDQHDGARRGRAVKRRRPQHSGMFLAVREFVIVIVMALAISLVIKTFLFQAFWIPSGSMENTLIRGDRVIVNKLVPGPFDLKRGDVVVFDDFGHWLPPSETQKKRTGLAAGAHDVFTFIGVVPNDDNDHLIKRIIGLPGDHVKCCNAKGQITVNGSAINEPFLYPGAAPSQTPFDITVPKGRLWVMGDNRANSADSRAHDGNSGGRTGSVPISAVTGRAVLLVWPLSRWNWLSNYGSTFAHVPAAAK